MSTVKPCLLRWLSFFCFAAIALTGHAARAQCPSAPVITSTDSSLCGTVRVNWTPQPLATSYSIHRQVFDLVADEFGPESVVAQLGQGTTSFLDFVPGNRSTRVRYRVAASRLFCATQVSTMAEAVAYKPPSAPQGLTVVLSCGGVVALTWVPSPEFAGQYTLFRSSPGQPPQAVATAPGSGSGIVENTAPLNVDLTYTLSLTNVCGTSPQSAPATTRVRSPGYVSILEARSTCAGNVIVVSPSESSDRIDIFDFSTAPGVLIGSLPASGGTLLHDAPAGVPFRYTALGFIPGCVYGDGDTTAAALTRPGPLNIRGAVTAGPDPQCNGLRVAWTRTANQDAAYNLHVRLHTPLPSGGESVQTLAVLNKDATEYVDSAATLGSVRLYSVLAINECDEVSPLQTGLSAGIRGPCCDSIDFNADTLFPDDVDLVDFLSILAGGPCSPGNTCNDIDFNNDGLFPDDNDLIAFLTVLAGGTC